MSNDKELKSKFKNLAQQKSDQYYPTKALKSFGFARGQCQSCKTFFWSTDKRKVCGDSSCVGGFSFIGSSPAKKQLDYIETWKEYAKIHKKLGYTEISRYPVVARWNPTTDFTIASIAAFQPYVVSGEVKPPANPLIIPQFCLRFNDIDNVGITGAHYVGFIMMGEHAFMQPKDYDTNKYITDHLTWLNKGMGLDNRHITIHEDSWAGGGNLGPSMEFFSAGLELSNQVYMQYEASGNSWKELPIKVLDMGQGHERVPWFTQGESTSYETTFPDVIKKLRKTTGLSVDKGLMKKFLPYAAWLNVDEISDVNAAWKRVSEKVGINTAELRDQILKQAALYSVAEHSRALLFALNDGALPSNVSGGYNLRVIFRRALSMLDKYKWDVSLPEVCSWHADYLKKLFPELKNNLTEVKTLLEVEKNKYENTREKARSIVEKVVKKKVNDETLLQLYDSHGIAPELIREEAERIGTKVVVPENFYARVSELHEKTKQIHETKREEKLELAGIQETKALYFGDWRAPESFTATVKKIVGVFVLLDETWFYPTSGGQLNDIGAIRGIQVIDVFKQGPYIIHKLSNEPSFKEGSKVMCSIDLERRKQLAQHHTSTHIINAATRRILGNHINQAGAKKTLEKGTIDVTHYASLNDEELLKIENEANKIVKENIPVHKSFMPRDEAEKRFGVNIYQGGVAPGKLLRIVEIPEVDVEACGGTHLNSTGEAGIIHIINSSKIADDIVRIEFVAGNAAKSWEKDVRGSGNSLAGMIKTELNTAITVSAHTMQLAAEVFSVPVEQLHETVTRFIGLVKENSAKLGTNNKFLSEPLDKFAKSLFEIWKQQNKLLEKREGEHAAEAVKKLKERSVSVLDIDAKALRDVASKFAEILLINKDGYFAFRGSETAFKKLCTLGAKGGGNDIKQGKVENAEKTARSFKF